MEIIELTDSQKTMMMDHAQHTYPHECCGILLNDGAVLPGKNTLGSISNGGADDAFILDQSTIKKAQELGGIKAFYHSHPFTTEQASKADLAGCTHSGFPWVIVSPLTMGYSIIYPDNGYIAPILGRPFLWGVLDCYKLVCDIYQQDLGIELPNDRDRGELFAWETDPEWRVLEDNFKRAGFYQLGTREPLRKYDVLLMVFDSPFGCANHCAVFLDVEKNQFIHHPLNSLSRFGTFGGWYKDITKYRLRHQLLRDVTKPTQPVVNRL